MAAAVIFTRVCLNTSIRFCSCLVSVPPEASVASNFLETLRCESETVMLQSIGQNVMILACFLHVSLLYCRALTPQATSSSWYAATSSSFQLRRLSMSREFVTKFAKSLVMGIEVEWWM